MTQTLLLARSILYRSNVLIYCSGIGGIGLSAYAAFQHSLGHSVCGSDRNSSPLIEDLRSQGIEVFLEQDGSHVPANADLFVYSEAVNDVHPERIRAQELSIPQQTYFEALGSITASYRLISIAGTHGKSSTTAMTAKVLMDAGSDPNVIVGTKLSELGGRNWRRGTSDLFVAESCEYRRSFRFLSPSIILLTNADGDHFDYYTSQQDYESAFLDFVSRLPEDGCLITHMNDSICARIAHQSRRRFIDADRFPLPTVGVPGLHMRSNAQLVLALASEMQIPESDAVASLAAFSGTWRRMEVKGVTTQGVTVVDDYAHHPVEIRATLQAMREAYPSQRIVVVFQPHTHDRMLKLYQDFLTAFSQADLVLIPDVYAARSERDSATVDVPALVKDIAKGSGIAVIDGHSIAETERLLRTEILRQGDVLITMGAGNVTEIAGRMMEPLDAAQDNQRK